MILNAIYSKLVSESLLSFYPTFVKKIDLSIFLQMFTRLITYVLISLFFINYSFIGGNLLKQESLILSIVNLFHIYASYEGFKNLDSGVSFSIFNVYPLLILLFSGVLWKPVYFIGIVGLLFFIYDNYNSNLKNNTLNSNFNYGVLMILLAAVTEAIIFFLVRNIKTENNWNHLFISYFWGAIITSIYLIFSDSKELITNMDTNQTLTSTSTPTPVQISTHSNKWFLLCTAILLNGIIGTIGYYLRFYSIYRLNPEIYSTLSYFGIIMAYFYGIFLNNESINTYKIIGTLLIIISNYAILQS
jgi:drug/metabolite transporter (DMT)-like permease